MSGIKALADFVRDALGVGINGASYSVKRLSDDTVIASGTTASDAVPLTALAGSLSVDESTLGYPGPVKYTVTDPVTGAVRVHTSKSIGQVGAWRSIDVTRGWRLAGEGVAPGVGGELAVSANGSTMVLTVAAGECLAAVADHGLIYSWPASRTVTVGASDGANPRIDTVVLRFYPPGVAEEGRIDLAIVAGTPSSSPAQPGLTRNSATYWEVALADVRVDAGVTSLAAGKVTDRRAYCLLYPSGIAAGDTFYVDASGKFARLAKGTSGQVLKQGATIPAWGAIANTDVSGLGTMSTQAASAVAITGGSIAGITDLAVADGGTGASDAATARTNLGLGNVDNTSDATKNAAVATLANKTLTTPTIGSFANAQHSHFDAASGGQFEYHDELTSTGVNNATNSSTSTAIEAQHLDFTLPAGTWSVRVAVDVGLTHSGGGSAYCSAGVDATFASSKGMPCSATTPARVVNSVVVTGIAAGAHTAYCTYRPQNTGTAAAYNPRIIVDAWRTA